MGGALLVMDHVVSVSRVDGDSMQPCLNPELVDRRDRPYITTDYVLLNKWKAIGYRVERGDIISIR